MTFKELIVLADKAYDADGIIMDCFECPDEEHGDGLARFIYGELKDTFDEKADTATQIEEALRVMRMAHGQLYAVIGALEDF
jgi:3-deoxy-D-arabino-heptulosonate 7-phosphate (DAHP) synthase